MPTVFLLFGISSAAAEENDLIALPEEYAEMIEGLPEALKESLPEAVFTESDSESIAAVWERLLSPRALGELVLEEVVAHRRVYFGLLLELLGILLVRAVWNCFAGTVRSSGIGSGIRTLCRLCLFGVIAAQALGMLEGVVAFYRDLGTLSTAFLPLMGSMYAMGGNVGAAVSNQSTLVMSLSLVEWLGGKSIVPLVSLCLAFSLLGVFESSVSGRMQVLTGKLKQWYTTALSLVMLLLSGGLAAQTTLAARADSLGFRTVRFAVSSNIPVVGGGVAEMLRTAATGISWLRGVVGVGGIVLLLWLLLPRIVSLLLYRLVYSVAADLALWMGCEEEGRMFSEIGSLQGYLLAVISVSVMTFFFALVILLRCGAAFGG